MIQIQIKISERLYIKDPEGTELGRKIVRQGLVLIDQVGLEEFNFKKLAAAIKSTEASIYRYFENKQKLLIYLMSWYWSWLQYKFDLTILTLNNPEDKLKAGISIFTHTASLLPVDTGFDMDALYRIVVEESPKAYLTKEIDEINKEGAFLSYKGFCKKLAACIREINPNYEYPTALVSSCVESAHDQKYFSEHLPSLTEVSGGKREEVSAFLHDLIFRVIK
ncbi:MAG: TetR/AcrR family transcriptional regulator [Bacteroidia bacterium]